VSSHIDKGSLIDENNRLAGKQVATLNKRLVETIVPVNMSSNGINPGRQRLQGSDFHSQPRNIAGRVSYLLHLVKGNGTHFNFL